MDCWGEITGVGMGWGCRIAHFVTEGVWLLGYWEVVEMRYVVIGGVFVGILGWGC